MTIRKVKARNGNRGVVTVGQTLISLMAATGILSVPDLGI